MKRMQSILPLFSLFAALVFVTGCNKNKPYDVKVPEGLVHFVGEEAQTYAVVVDPAPIYQIIVGTTDVADVDRSVSFSISSSTGAQAGREYIVAMSGNTVTIPAGETRAYIPIQGNVDYFSLGEKHKLEVTLSPTDMPVAIFNEKMTLNMRGPCFDTDIVFTDLLGNYTRTFENGSYGPYLSTITGFKAISETSGSAVISNLYDSGIPATAIFDWSEIGNYTITIPDQSTGFTLGGVPLMVRSLGTENVFTYCTPSFKILIELYTAGGTYDIWEMTMAR